MSLSLDNLENRFFVGYVLDRIKVLTKNNHAIKLCVSLKMAEKGERFPKFRDIFSESDEPYLGFLVAPIKISAQVLRDFKVFKEVIYQG